MKVSAFVAISLDGYLARPNGDTDWMHAGASGTDYGYTAFYESVDTLVMGSHAFVRALSQRHWPYGSKRVFVLSSQYVDIPLDLVRHVEISRLEPAALVPQLQAEGLQHVSVDGGATIQRFILAGLLSEITITRLPILLGDGLPLFAPGIGEHALDHQESKAWPDGLVQSRYRILSAFALE
ncbi:MAG: dihydrofolate reductase family protein [Burkholderiaceae bacterium]